MTDTNNIGAQKIHINQRATGDTIDRGEEEEERECSVLKSCRTRVDSSVRGEKPHPLLYNLVILLGD